MKIGGQIPWNVIPFSELQPYCYTQDWMKNGVLILWNAVAICVMFNISWLMENTYERRFKEPLKGPFIPFGAIVEYHPISAKDQ